MTSLPLLVIDNAKLLLYDFYLPHFEQFHKVVQPMCQQTTWSSSNTSQLSDGNYNVFLNMEMIYGFQTAIICLGHYQAWQPLSTSGINSQSGQVKSFSSAVLTILCFTKMWMVKTHFYFLISAAQLILNSPTIGTKRDIIFFLKVQLALDIS